MYQSLPQAVVTRPVCGKLTINYTYIDNNRNQLYNDLDMKDMNHKMENTTCEEGLRDTMPSGNCAPLIAYELAAGDEPSRYSWVLKSAIAVEYTPDPEAPSNIHPDVLPFINAGIPVRFHARYPEWEFGNADTHRSEQALRVHCNTIDKIQGLGEPVLTVHVGLDKNALLDYERVKENLCRLTDYAGKKGIKVNLENLRTGITSDPEIMLDLTEASGARITFDVGHAVSSKKVAGGEYTVPEIIEMFGSRINGVHIYGKEEQGCHYPVENARSVAPIMDKLLLLPCNWWTVELKDCTQAECTRKILVDYIHKSIS